MIRARMRRQTVFECPNVYQSVCHRWDIHLIDKEISFANVSAEHKLPIGDQESYQQVPLKGNTKTSILCMNSVTCSVQLPE